MARRCCSTSPTTAGSARAPRAASTWRSCACAPPKNRRWILRATNDGITATIDSAGRLRGTLPLYTEATSYTGFSYISDRTVYTRCGDWFPALCAAIALLCLVAGRVL